MSDACSIFYLRLSARFCSLPRNADRLTPTRENMNPLFGIDSPMDTPMDGRHGYGTAQTKQLGYKFLSFFCSVDRFSLKFLLGDCTLSNL